MPKATALITNFTAGELSPLLDVRTDTEKYRNGASKLRNALVMPHGGAKKRPGTMFVFPQRQSSFSSLLVPFQFNTEQAYMVEFGASVLRFYKDRGIITGPPVNISAATKANPCVVTAVAHGFSNGDLVVIGGVVGMTELNNRTYVIGGVTTDTFQLVGINSSAFGTYVSGGTVARPIELAHGYASADIDDLCFAQSADTLFISHPNYPIRKLTRSSHVAWTLTNADITNGPFKTINADTSFYLNVSTPTGSSNITGITKAVPAVLSSTGVFREGSTVTVAGVGGMAEVNGKKYVLRNVVTGVSAELWNEDGTPLDSTGFTTYTSGGTITRAVTSFGTVSPGTTVVLTASKPIFTAAHVGASFRLWEPGKGTGIATPAADTSAIANNSMYTFNGRVYGMLNMVTNDNPHKWETDWTPPTHDSGVVRILDITGTEYHDSVYLHDSSCVLQITSFTSSQSVMARVVGKNHVPKVILTSVTGTPFWEEGAWSAVQGYPSVISFHESRLWAAASTLNPQTIWSSRVGAFEDFQDGADDDRAIIYEIASDKVDKILWINSGKTLMFGTASAEYAAAASSQNEALTPSNARIVRQTPFGSSKVQPLRVSNAILFGQREGAPGNPARKLRELQYSFEVDSFVAPDLTIISEHITGSGITEMAFQSAPDAVAWCARTDGQLAALAYEKEQNIAGWSLHSLGGPGVAVERVAVIPGAGGDELWLGVRRTIGGNTVRYIEILTDGLRRETTKEDAIYLDAALSYAGPDTSVINGLWHLEGETISALVNGAKQGPFTVASGRITLSSGSDGGPVHVGYSYLTIIESVDLDAAAASGTAKSRAKRVSEVWPSLYRSLGGRAGPNENRMFDILYRDSNSFFGSSPALKTDFIRQPMPGGYNRRAYIRFEHDEPYPFTVLGIAAEISTSG